MDDRLAGIIEVHDCQWRNATTLLAAGWELLSVESVSNSTPHRYGRERADGTQAPPELYVRRTVAYVLGRRAGVRTLDDVLGGKGEGA